MTVMTRDDLFGDDPYRQRVDDSLGGIAPRDDFPAPVSSPSGGYDLEGFRKRWMSSGDVNDPNAWLQGNQDITSGVTLRNEKAYDPSGRFIADLVGNYSQPGQTRSRIFLDGIDSNTGRARTSSPRTSAQSSNSGGQAPAPAANNFLNQIREMIMGRLGQMQQAPTMDDPVIAGQNRAYGRSVDRGAADTRAAMAERAAANGLLLGGQSSGGFDTTVQGINEEAGERKAAFGANLLGGEVARRYAEVQNLMNMALQSGDAESARALQMELAKLDAQLRRESLAQQGRQFDANLAQQGSQFNANLGFQQGQWNDTYGRQLSRDDESDYMTRVLLGLGA